METLADRLALTAAALDGEWWRLWTCHVVHYSASHAALNAAAALPVAVFVRSWRCFAIWLLCAAPLVAIGVLLLEPAVHYRGASALVLGAWFLAGLSSLRTPLRRYAFVLLGLACVKLTAEALGMIPWSVGVESSYDAHALGALAGIAGGLAGHVVFRAKGKLGSEMPIGETEKGMT
jgi:membrane associated rhomboid family serine protease